MAGLVLNLRPNERFLVNGVVMRNGAKRAQIRVEDENANVLRLRDAIHPDDVDTPVKRAYYTAQLIISGDLGEAEGAPALAVAIADLREVFCSGEAAERLEKAALAVADGHYYSVLCQLRNVLPIEHALLNYVARPVASAVSDRDRQVA